MLNRTVRILAICPLFVAVLASCTSNRGSSMALQCKEGLSAAYREMNEAEANGFHGAVGITKAASLLAAAKVQSEFKRYPNCVDKVRRARIHISRAQEQ